MCVPTPSLLTTVRGSENFRCPLGTCKGLRVLTLSPSRRSMNTLLSISVLFHFVLQPRNPSVNSHVSWRVDRSRWQYSLVRICLPYSELEGCSTSLQHVEWHGTPERSQLPLVSMADVAGWPFGQYVLSTRSHSISPPSSTHASPCQGAPPYFHSQLMNLRDATGFICQAQPREDFP